MDTNELRQFSQTFWVSSCVKTLMDEIASLDWDIVPQDEFEYDWVQEAIKKTKDFLKIPNSNGEPINQIIKALIKDILELDAGCMVKVFDISSYDFNQLEPKSGAPLLKPRGERTLTELYVRDGASFLKEIDKFGFCKGYWQYSYQIPAHPMWFNKDEIVYISEHPRSMSCYGYARTQAILDVVKSLHYSTLYNKRFFEETPIPDGALSLLDTNEVEMKDFITWWNGEFKAQPHKIAVMNKEMKWQPFNISQRELEFLETQKWYYNLVISCFGLTPSEMGITEDVNRATSATQSELVKRKGVRPFLKLIESFINAEILPEFGYEGIEFQFIYDDPAEKNARLSNWQMELTMGVKTVNEVRLEMGLEPMAGGDISNNWQSRIGNMPPESPQEAAGKVNEETEGEQAEEGQSGNYEDTREREEGKNEKDNKNEKEDKERKKKIQHPYNDTNRPTTVKSYTGGIDEQQVQIGGKKERKEHPELPEGMEYQIAIDHLREDASYYINNTETKKGVDDGQYYRDQTFKPSQGHIQPQNKTQLAGPTTPMTQPIDYTDTNPSQLGSNYQQITQPSYKEDGQIHCPICGQPTIANLNSLETDMDDTRCTACGARFKSEDLLNAKMLEEMYNVIQASNAVEPISIPSWSPKSCNCGMHKDLDLDMDIKEFCGFDTTKSAKHSISYVDSKAYKKLMRDYLSNISAEKREKIAVILKNAMRDESSIREVTKKINRIIDDEARAESIARTEIIRISNEGNIMLMEERGAEKVEWISAPEDGRLCKECKKHDGKHYSIDAIKGKLPLHPNCRCTCVEIYE